MKIFPRAISQNMIQFKDADYDGIVTPVVVHIYNDKNEHSYTAIM